MIDKEESLKNVGSNIRHYRELRGMSLEELASKCGYESDNGRSSMSKIERGKNDIPASKLKKIADILCVSPSALLGNSSGEDPQHQDPDQAVLDLYHRLDSTDQAKVVERMEVLLEADKYAKGKESQAG